MQCSAVPLDGVRVGPWRNNMFAARSITQDTVCSSFPWRAAAHARLRATSFLLTVQGGSFAMLAARTITAETVVTLPETS